jgi:hypothetical protein
MVYGVYSYIQSYINEFCWRRHVLADLPKETKEKSQIVFNNVLRAIVDHFPVDCGRSVESTDRFAAYAAIEDDDSYLHDDTDDESNESDESESDEDDSDLVLNDTTEFSSEEFSDDETSSNKTTNSNSTATTSVSTNNSSSNVRSPSPTSSVVSNKSTSNLRPVTRYILRRNDMVKAKEAAEANLDAQFEAIDKRKRAEGVPEGSLECDICDQPCRNYTGIKIHYSRMHRGVVVPDISSFKKFDKY